MLIETIILGLIQGLTEWIPISSTGHLRITEYFLSLELPLFFDIILHIGTLIITFFFFRSDIKKIISSITSWEFKTENGKLVPLILVGTIPTLIIGFFFNSFIVSYFNDLLPLSGAYIFCGIILYLAKTGKEKKNSISYFEATQIGIIQGIAVIPGLSRSGFTIAIALLLGIKNELAFKFSFLLSIPAIIGGLSLTLFDQLNTVGFVGVDFIDILIGISVSSLVGYFSLNVLKGILLRKKFYLFSFYCWIISIILIVFVIIGF
jgi:undecaprenyl-diphosphatase